MDILIKNQIEIYRKNNGKIPFVEWLENLKDKKTKYRIMERLDRVAVGNMGDHKRITGDLFELRFNFGSGFRIYYGEVRNKIIILLCGGDKSSQQQDIRKAIAFWRDYLAR